MAIHPNKIRTKTYNTYRHLKNSMLKISGILVGMRRTYTKLSMSRKVGRRQTYVCTKIDVGKVRTNVLS